MDGALVSGTSRSPITPQVIEDYVYEPAVLSPADETWAETARLAGARALALLTSSEALGGGAGSRQAACTLGRCLHLLSTSAGPDDPELQWKVEGCGSEGVTGEGGLGGGEGPLPSSLSVVMRKEEAEHAEVCKPASSRLPPSPHWPSCLQLAVCPVPPLLPLSLPPPQLQEATSLQLLSQASCYLAQAVDGALHCKDVVSRIG